MKNIAMNTTVFAINIATTAAMLGLGLGVVALSSLQHLKNHKLQQPLLGS